ncbi:MAG: hypothetical protein WCO33_02610 [bacterium]
MKYQINISGIHCNGCVNLIKMSFEDEGFTDIQVKQDSNKASFISPDPIEQVNTILTKVFNELKEYKYSNLQILE